jgi:hypothetical protein
VARLIQNIYEDAIGTTVDIKFNEAVTAASVESLANYTATGRAGGPPLSAIIVKLQKDKETLRVVFDRPVIPGETTIGVSTATDLAGNVMPAASGLKIQAYEQNPPTLVRAKAAAVPGMNNDTLSVGYSEAVIPEDATNLANYRLDGPGGQLDLSGAEATYDAPTQTALITLRNRAAKPIHLIRNAVYRAHVSNVRDIGGNKIAARSSMEAVAEGDSAPPSVVSAVRNVVLDPSQATVDLTFNEAVDRESVEDQSNYQVKGERKLTKVELLGDSCVARLKFDGPVAKAMPVGAMGVGIVLLLIAALVLPWVLRLSGGAAVALRVVLLILAIILAAVIATGKAAPTRIRLFHVRDLAGNERSVVAVPTIKTLERIAPRVVSARVSVSPDGQRKTVSVTFDK